MPEKRYFVSYFRVQVDGKARGPHIENGFVTGDPILWAIQCRKSRPQEEITLISYHEISEVQYDEYMEVGSLGNVEKEDNDSEAIGPDDFDAHEVDVPEADTQDSSK